MGSNMSTRAVDCSVDLPSPLICSGHMGQLPGPCRDPVIDELTGAREHAAGGMTQL